MKAMKKYMVVFCAIFNFFSCDNNKAPNLSGVYVNEARSDYSSACDTLYISVISLENKTYQVDNRVGYRRIKNNTMLPRQYKIQSWQAIWNAEKRLLSEGDLGRQIRISPDGEGVFMKATEFRRIK